MSRRRAKQNDLSAPTVIVALLMIGLLIVAFKFDLHLMAGKWVMSFLAP